MLKLSHGNVRLRRRLFRMLKLLDWNYRRYHGPLFVLKLQCWHLRSFRQFFCLHKLFHRNNWSFLGSFHMCKLCRWYLHSYLWSLFLYIMRSRYRRCCFRTNDLLLLFGGPVR